MKEKKICPRCGQKYSYIERRRIGDQVYLYAVHYLKVEGKRKVRKCYLGPESEYIYVSKMHEFRLRGPLDKSRVLKYLNSLLHIISVKRDELDPKTKREIIERLSWTIKILEGEDEF